ncbi:MAG: hypothetical protein JW910_04775 [Anaerolineae bacterium]|nr:hypothetical protein [Anaerolineae bacterium]
MNWRRQLRLAWGNLPGSIRRLLLAALITAVLLLVLSFAGGHDLQLAAVLGLFALFIAVQAVILWLLWRQNPEFRRARRAYLAEDFAGVIVELEPLEAEGRLDAGGAALLGNAYRQLGRLAESERVLRAAHEADPDSPFPAYGLGRTLFAQGLYTDASALIAHALARRGQPTIVADLGHAQCRAGQHDAALESLRQADRIELEPHRALMTRYLLWRLEGEPADVDIVARLTRYDHGLATWHAEAERFQETPYGAALAADLATIERLLEGQDS